MQVPTPDDDTLEELLGLVGHEIPSGMVPGSRLGPYVVINEIARGGMGVVYLANHCLLQRLVALKVLQPGTSLEHIARLTREAKLAAQLTHPGIVAIQETGSQDGQHFIAMDYVAGQTLQAALPTFSRGERIEKIEQIARIVDYAHQKGILHRDLKPSNVLLDETKQPRVTDFGLARKLEESAQLTRSGTVLGTPMYMSPEQIEGRRHDYDARTDVYALGVMLYLALTDRLPFTGDTTHAVFLQILRGQPPRPSELMPGLEVTLDAICLTAMHKDQESRYPTAVALAEDLSNHLSNKPINAKLPSSFRARSPWIRRVAIVAPILLLAVLAFGWRRGWFSKPPPPAPDQTYPAAIATLKRSLTQILELRRRGELKQMELRGQQAEQTGWRSLGRWPEKTALHLLRGKIYRALMQEEEARRAIDQALKISPNHAAALYERILLGSFRYQRRVEQLLDDELRRLDPSSTLMPSSFVSYGKLLSPELLTRSDSAAQQIRDQVRRDATRLAPQAAQLPPGLQACSRGLSVWTDGKPVQARPLLEQALLSQPGLVEAQHALAILSRRQDLFPIALRHCVAGQDHDKGYLPLIEQRARLELDWARLPSQPLTRARQHLQAAIQHCDRGLSLRKRWDRLLAIRLQAHLRLGTQLVFQHQPIDKTFGGALASAEQLSRLFPRSADCAREVGRTHYNWGAAQQRLGLDPSQQYQLALAAYDRARTLEPDRARGLTQALRGRTHIGIAHHQTRVGRDPLAAFERGIAELNDAVALVGHNTGHAETYMWRAEAYLRRAEFQSQRGRNATPDLKRAIADLAVANTRRPGWSITWHALGYCQAALARAYPPGQGAAASKAAIEGYQQALRRAPKEPQLLNELARTLVDRGQYGNSPGGRPQPDYLAAVRLATQAIRLQPSSTEALVQRAKAHGAMARLQIEAGQDPLRLLNLAEKDISQALRRKPNAEAHNIRGTCQLLRGEWWDKNAQKEQAVVATRSAAREMQRSVQINPRYLDSWHKLGLASFLLAGFAADANEDPGPHFTRARESYLKMLGVQPNNPTALLGLGHAFSNEAALLLRKGQPESARPKLEAAIRRYEQAKACSDQQTSLTAQKRLAELRTWQVRQR